MVKKFYIQSNTETCNICGKDFVGNLTTTQNLKKLHMKFKHNIIESESVMTSHKMNKKQFENYINNDNGIDYNIIHLKM